MESIEGDVISKRGSGITQEEIIKVDEVLRVVVWLSWFIVKWSFGFKALAIEKVEMVV